MTPEEVLAELRDVFASFTAPAEVGTSSGSYKLQVQLMSGNTALRNALERFVEDNEALKALLVQIRSGKTSTPHTRHRRFFGAIEARFPGSCWQSDGLWHRESGTSYYVGGVKLTDWDLLVVPPHLVERREGSTSSLAHEADPSRQGIAEADMSQSPTPRKSGDRAHRHTSFA